MSARELLAEMGVSVLDSLADWFGRYVKTTGPEELWLLALWAAHTHVIHQCRTTPRLIVTSPLPGAGKTTALEHLDALTRNGMLFANAPTASVMGKLPSLGYTILIDEADKHLGAGGEDVRTVLGVVNSGYKASGTYLVNEPDQSGGWTPVQRSAFAPVAMAGIAPDLPDDTMSRSVQVLLLPDVTGTVEETDWELIEDDAKALHDRLAAWAGTVALERGESLPETVTGRLREVWRPLARVAQAVGGAWPERCYRLAEQHAEQVLADREDGTQYERPHVRLVRDIYGVWHVADPGSIGFAPTRDLLDALHQHAPTDWGSLQPGGRRPLTPQGMGRMLAGKCGVRSTQETTGERRRRGYMRDDFRQVWRAIGLTDDGDVIAVPADEVA